MRCEIVSGEQNVGTLRWERQGLYTRFYGAVTVMEVTKIYGVFEGGTCPLGVPVPEQGKMVLRVSMPTARLPGGKLLQGRLGSGDGWSCFPGGSIGGVRYPAGLRKGNVLRFSWEPGDSLPAPEVLLFYRYVEENGKGYLELRLEEDGSVSTKA